MKRTPFFKFFWFPEPGRNSGRRPAIPPDLDPEPEPDFWGKRHPGSSQTTKSRKRGDPHFGSKLNLLGSIFLRNQNNTFFVQDCFSITPFKQNIISVGAGRNKNNCEKNGWACDGLSLVWNAGGGTCWILAISKLKICAKARKVGIGAALYYVRNQFL